MASIVLISGSSGAKVVDATFIPPESIAEWKARSDNQYPPLSGFDAFRLFLGAI